MAFLNFAQTPIIQTIGSDDADTIKGAQLDIHSSYGGFNFPPSRIMYAISSIKQLQDIWNRKFLGENKSKKKLTIEEIIEKLGIKPEDPEQLEGNIFVDTIFTSEFYPFDNQTIEEVSNILKMNIILKKLPRTFESRNINYLYHCDMTLAFPTESGLPFIYTLTIPQLMRFNSGGSFKVLRNESTAELTVVGHIIASEKFQSRIGFVTPFEHRHYIAGIDINLQIFIPAGLNYKSIGERNGNKRLELKMDPRYHRYGTGHMAVHHSVVPYISRYDILNLQPIILSNDTRLVHTKEPHGIEFSICDATIAARSDYIDSKASKKTGIEALTEIFNVFYNGSGAHYRRFDAIMNLMTTQVNLTFNSFLELHNPDSSKATIPAILDKRPNSETRRQQFLKEVNKDINSATGYINDISISTKRNNYVLTYAIANSYVDKKLQALVYWNIQSPKNGEVFQEFCSVGLRSKTSPEYTHVAFYPCCSPNVKQG